MVIANVAKSPAGPAESPAPQAIRPQVFIVSDVRLLCDGLVLSLSQQPSVTVVGSAELARASAGIAELRPDVLLLDVGSPGWARHAGHAASGSARLKVVAIAVADVEQEVLACAEAGVSGFVSRNGSIQDLVTAVHCAVRDELVCSPRIAALLFNRIAAIGPKGLADRDNGTLTLREHEIVAFITEGLSNKAIARQLRI
jgi:two-component system nitrate/nitrite response regulator NarL